MTVGETGLYENAIIFVVVTNLKGAAFADLVKEINIKFIKNNKKPNCLKINSNPELFGLLKLSLLKEISVKLDDNQLEKLPKMVSYILMLLRKGAILDENMKEKPQKN